MLRAQLLGTLKGRRVYRVPVRVHLNDSHRLDTEYETHEVIAYTPSHAANYVRDLYATRPETEVFAFGPKGGTTYRYVGWWSAIGQALVNRHASRQLALPFTH